MTFWSQWQLAAEVAVDHAVPVGWGTWVATGGFVSAAPPPPSIIAPPIIAPATLPNGTRCTTTQVVRAPTFINSMPV